MKATTQTKKRKPTPLWKKADKAFSRYVRIRDCWYRDGEWWGKCITCSKTGSVAWYDEKGTLRFRKGWDPGHFIGRSNWYLRYDEENVNLQCSFACNKMKSGNLEKYKPALDLKYGEGTWRRLSDEAQANTKYRQSKEELETILHDCEEQLTWLQKNRT